MKTTEKYHGIPRTFTPGEHIFTYERETENFVIYKTPTKTRDEYFYQYIPKTLLREDRYGLYPHVWQGFIGGKEIVEDKRCCKRDTDFDGNCPVHPPKTTPRGRRRK